MKDDQRPSLPSLREVRFRVLTALVDAHQVVLGGMPTAALFIPDTIGMIRARDKNGYEDEDISAMIFANREKSQRRTTNKLLTTKMQQKRCRGTWYCVPQDRAS